ncbi:hypothetical protein [Bradyrhizobium genosp. P]|uniref:hypothetical protein n=1 Tax=Bradyrhizobium genosp. P TaxID=83641 RepID=UPI003CF45B3F
MIAFDSDYSDERTGQSPSFSSVLRTADLRLEVFEWIDMPTLSEKRVSATCGVAQG